jgi:hypothetical protein
VGDERRADELSNATPAASKSEREEQKSIDADLFDAHTHTHTFVARCVVVYACWKRVA